MDLDEVADALYGLPREEFTPARDARAKEAKAGGDRELASAIGRLRRPTVAAWLVNRLAREDPDRLSELADLGESMRAAHDRLDGAALRELSAQRRTLVSTLTDAARAAGRNAGTPVSETVTRELEEIFTASLASADAARALSLGRLTTAKELADAANHWPNATLPRRGDAAGTPSRQPRPSESTATAHHVDGHGASAPEERAPASAATGTATADKPAPANAATGTATADEPARPSAAVLRARRELAELEQRLADSERAHAEAEADHERAAEEEADAHRAVADRRAELVAAEQAERDARQRARTARRAHEDTERVLRETRRRVAVARERLTALDNG